MLFNIPPPSLDVLAASIATHPILCSMPPMHSPVPIVPLVVSIISHVSLVVGHIVPCSALNEGEAKCPPLTFLITSTTLIMRLVAVLSPGW